MYGERYKPPGGGNGETSKPLKWGLGKSAACVMKKGWVEVSCLEDSKPPRGRGAA